MRCSKCVAAAKPHSVVEEDKQESGGIPQRSWDTQDQEHRHDPRWALVFYHCSNGHSFSQAGSVPPCPAKGCHWQSERQAAIDKTIAARDAARK